MMHHPHVLMHPGLMLTFPLLGWINRSQRACLSINHFLKPFTLSLYKTAYTSVLWTLLCVWKQFQETGNLGYGRHRKLHILEQAILGPIEIPLHECSLGIRFLGYSVICAVRPSALYEPEQILWLGWWLTVLTLFPVLGCWAFSQAKCEAMPSIFVPCSFWQWELVCGSLIEMEELFLVSSQHNSSRKTASG